MAPSLDGVPYVAVKKRVWGMKLFMYQYGKSIK